MKKIISILFIIMFIAACQKSITPDPSPVKHLIDIDGNGYDTINIITQFWMKQNLKTSHYRNGDLIPEITSDAKWATLTNGAWCWYNNDSVTYAATYGKLYNWYAVNDPRGLAPTGWHIPNEAEWTSVSTALGGDSAAGGKMKETDTTHWIAPNNGATNSSGFTCLPGGHRFISGSFENIRFSYILWGSTEFNTNNAWVHHLYNEISGISRQDANKKHGFSIRCLKD